MQKQLDPADHREGKKSRAAQPDQDASCCTLSFAWGHQPILYAEWDALFVHTYDSTVPPCCLFHHSVLHARLSTCYPAARSSSLLLPLLNSSLWLWPSKYPFPAFTEHWSRAGLRSEPFPRPNHPLVQGGSSHFHLEPTTASFGTPDTPMTGRKTR